MKRITVMLSLLTPVLVVSTYGESILESLGISASEPLPTDRQRVIVDKKTDVGHTVLASNGEMLRGNAVWLWRAKLINKPSVLAYAFEEGYYQALSDSGVNFIRLCIYAQANDWGGGTNYRDTDEVAFLLERTDKVVDMASKYGMYVMLNYHDVGKYRGEYGDKDAPTMGYLKDFWNVFAPYYSKRTHVFYELVNEPAFGCSNFTDELLDSMDAIYEYVRPMVSETHLSLLCITGAVGKSWDGRTMDQVVDRYVQRHPNSVDWSNASIAFHPYVNKDKVYSSEPIVNVMKDYAVINSEANYPCDDAVHRQVVDADKQCQTVDGELFINQTMERLGVSWNQHKSLGWDYFPNNWPLILKDAREKGYIWFPNDVTRVQEGRRVNDGTRQGSRTNEATWAQWTYRADGSGAVTFDIAHAQSVAIRLINAKGISVIATALHDGHRKISAHLPAGVYVVELSAGYGFQTGRIVVP